MYHAYDHAGRAAESHQQWTSEANSDRMLREAKAEERQAEPTRNVFARLVVAFNWLRGPRQETVSEPAPITQPRIQQS